MSSSGPPQTEIEEFEKIINDKMNKNRQERSTLNQLEELVSKIKMKSRTVEVTPPVEAREAKPAVTDKNDSTKIITPATVAQSAKPAVTKTVYDVPPEDPMIPGKEMSGERRTEIFDSCKKILASLNSV